MAERSRLRSFTTGLTARTRAILAGIALGLVIVLVASNHFLTQRFADLVRNEGQLRAALYSGNMISHLKRQEFVPQLIALDPVLIDDLDRKDFTTTSQRLIEVTENIQVASISVLDVDGRVVAASERRDIGRIEGDKPYHVEALRAENTVLTISGEEDGRAQFYYSRKVVAQSVTVGVVVVEVDMRVNVEPLINRGELIAVIDSTSRVILSSRLPWHNLNIEEAIAAEPAPSAFTRVLAPFSPHASMDDVVFIDGQAQLMIELNPGFRGWRFYYFEPMAKVRSEVIGYLLAEALVLTLLMAALLLMAFKRLQRQSQLIVEESDQLRMLNARLSAEIEERQRVERDLKVAEQSLEQTSKLAAIGQMSAAVSHELNQPLAAMRTYLAGARLLLQRARVDEALSSFHRIDDLLERMGAITRQMKSYARKGTDALVEVDIRDAVDGSLAMMSPQLGQTRVELRKTMPNVPVPVQADPVRLDQIIVNLLRNAIEASAEEEHPLIDILVVQGRQVSLSIRDNGHGIEDPDALFEPFYTTKKPGEGVGLGLAISAGIAKELGGRLTARNAEPQGAIFELQLPRAEPQSVRAAE